MSRPPSPCSFIRTIAARAQVKVPLRWTWVTRSKSSSVIFHTTLSRSTPALATRTSRRPKASTAASTRAWADSDEPTAAATAMALPPAAVISAAAA